ncbi:hypothetical protein PMAYCL1PPCAC_00328 [Pristionchus mayeri]|uniref:Cytoplasmic polyadenylation element-binding protein 1 n=1 Tax=Pristionchus mayeri TaxID=1317129 RepID=A0AAN4Z2F8_9BILA|nr:hypothetical protein PMAYCL1PPCAC_00327 [Pristionchus mayeri]GMR30133.1 hypothetical protein PMAYCL1PPCAC_00328 [Pristionchus mayeri]
MLQAIVQLRPYEGWLKSHQGYHNVIKGKFVRIPHVDSNKKEVEVKPYVLDGQQCDECQGKKCDGRSAPHFCGDMQCLQCYCVTCWDDMHYTGTAVRAKHCPLVRLGDQTKAMNIVPDHVIPPSASGLSMNLERQIDSILFPPSAPSPPSSLHSKGFTFLFFSSHFVV